MTDIDWLVSTISADDVDRYLTSRGWRSLPDKADEEGYVFFEAPIRDDFGNRIEIAVPMAAPDLLAEAVPRVLKIASAVERRSRYDIAVDMSPVSNDVLSVRIISTTRRSAIRLSSAPGMYRALHGLFLSGASVETNPAPFHKYPSRLGSDYAAGLLLRPARERSFSFAIQSELAGTALVNHFQGSAERAAGFKRSVMARVVRGLYRCRSAADAGNRWDNLHDEFKVGLNANMCDAVVRIYQEVAAPETEIEFSVAWSPKLATPADLRDVGPITFTENVVQSAYQLAGALRREPVLPVVDVIGHVTGLKDTTTTTDEQQLSFGYEDDSVTEPDTFDVDRVVTVRVERAVDSGGINFSTLYMSLDDDHYAVACDAHNPKTKRPIRAKGQLVRRGRKWVLDPCLLFVKVD